jgi:hypothetical protein
VQVVVVVCENLGDVYRVETEVGVAEFTIDAHLPALSDQRIEIVAAKRA